VIAKLEESRTKFAASQTGSFCNDCSPPLYSATALPLKAETFRLLADMADVFFVQCVGYGAFRGGGSRYHHRGCRWLYKGWAKATSPRREKTESKTGRKQSKTEEEEPRKKQKNGATRKEQEKKKGNIYTNKDCPCHCCIPTTRKTKEDPKTDIHSKPASSLLILSS